MEKKDVKKNYEALLNTYFEERKKIYNTPEKKVCFILGVHIKRIVNKQYKEIESTPFLNRVKAFNLNGLEDIKKLFNEASGKMIEYKMNFILGMRLLKEYFEDITTWNLSNVDLNFYILLGYASYQDIFNNKQKNNEGDKK